MPGTNLWVETGVVRKNLLLKVKLTITSKSASSTATVGDYYEFNCKSKGLPAFADAPTWTDVTDNATEPTGFAYAGKSEQIDVIELTTRTPLPTVYTALLANQSAGDVFSLTYTYDDPHETKIYTLTVPNVQIVGISPEAGEVNAGSQTTIKLLAEGGKSDNMPEVAETPRT